MYFQLLRMAKFFIYFFLLVFSILIFPLEGFSQQNQQLLPVKVKGKWGYINLHGKIVVAPVYDKATEFNGKLAKVEKDNKVLIINQLGKTIPGLEYENIRVLSDSLLAVKTAGKWGLADPTGKILIAPAYNTIKLSNSKNHFLAGEKNAFGLIDAKGKFIVPQQFDSVRIQGNFFIAEAFLAKVIYGTKGIELLKTVAEKFELYNDSFLLFKNVYWGAISLSGKHLKPEWTRIKRINNRFISLEKEENAYIYHLQSGKIIHVGEYAEYSNFDEDRLLVKTPRGNGLLDENGEIIIPFQYDDIDEHRSYLYISRNGKTGFATKNGKWILKPKYDFIEPFSKDLPNTTLVKDGENWGAINISGKEILPVKYREIDLFKNLAKAYQGTTTTFYDIDKGGNITGSEEYLNAQSINIQSTQTAFFRNSRKIKIPAKKSGWFYSADAQKWGFRDSAGKIAIPLKYHTIKVFANTGLVLVGLRQEAPIKLALDEAEMSFRYLYGLVEIAGLKEILPPVYARIELNNFFNHSASFITALQPDGKFVIIDKNGKVNTTDYAYIGDAKNGLTRFLTSSKLTIKQENSAHNTVISVDSFLQDLQGASISYMKNFTGKAVLVQQGGKWGFLDTVGNIKIQPIFDFTYGFFNDKAIVLKDKKWGVINSAGEAVLPISYNHISYFQSGNRHFRISAENPKYGFISLDETIAISPRYEEITNFKEDAAIIKSGDRFAFINADGDTISKTTFKAARDFNNNFAAAKPRGRWGFMNRSGEMIGEAQYIRCGDLHKGLAWVREDKYFGYIDTSGKIVIGEKYTSAKDFDENGLAIVRNKKGKYSVINTSGETIIPFNHTKILPFSDGFTIAKSGGFVILNSKGEIVKNLGRYNDFEPFSEGLAAFRSKDKYGFIDTFGNEVITAKLDKPGKFVNGVCIIATNNHTHYVIDRNGNTIIEDKYKIIGDFTDGLALAKDKDSSYFYIDKSGENAFQQKYTEASVFKEGFARVKYKDKWQIIGSDGKVVLSPEYDSVGEPSDGKIIVRSNYFYGLADENGKILAEPQYNEVTHLPGTNVFKLIRADELGYVDYRGKWIWTLQK